ncbi:isoleucine--tRNA ligase, chloroplastic/mitochondrial-like isoform X2 [Dendrobium catenatum]|uniref:isoleucine--tRNA ligase, chloroplastic/mitochondrial-like isoform X2 n=1 Tax=Dendrobium catenatum TaxID=906689 RepID=UPI0010A0373B|nr:isoleucine--tRNA ligase, chloroplastic/mitochondrial-like isoform X2 [Dendrobium catenatum]
MTASRSDWCISRQRTWGVPIPVFYHVDTKEPLITEETISHIKAIISKKGSDAWWYMSTEELLPEKFRSSAPKYQKGTDTMDVWFDSGSSWAAVLGKREGLSLPADLYLEGTDQHRGWFQSSLLTSIATTDEKGLKMSKSLGNVVDPEIIISGGKNKDEPSYGADVLRLWVSSVDYTGDVLIGPQILRQMSDVYRKFRGTLRYLLSNLHDWKLAHDWVAIYMAHYEFITTLPSCKNTWFTNTMVCNFLVMNVLYVFCERLVQLVDPGNSISYDALPKIDQYALYQLENIVKIVKDSYDNYQFYKIFQILQRFAIVDLSNFYFDVAKDRLYVGGSTSFTRRSCQTVLAAHLLSIIQMIAPILPHLAEDAWQNLPFEHVMDNGSIARYVFDLRWSDLNERWLSMPASEADFWGSILELRSEVNKVLEVARGGKLIGSSLEAKVYIYTSDAATSSQLQEMCGAMHEADSLHRIFITSQVEVLAGLDEMVQTVQYTGSYTIQANIEVWIGVSRADGMKCERCWNYSPNVGMFSEHPTLCSRCNAVIGDSQPLQASAQVC